MRTAIVGTGRIGGTLARLLVGAGHQVLLAGGRGPDALAPLVAELGPPAAALEPDAAAREGDVVILAVPFRAIPTLFPQEAVRGRILVDATNAFPSQSADSTTSTEKVAQWYPEARVVKALNTMNFKALGATAGRGGADRLAHYVAGDDQQAKGTVADLITSLGFAVVDTGPLHEGGLRQQPGSALFNVERTEEQARQVLDAVET